MSIVTVKNKFQVVIPQSVRKEIGVNIGDMLEARAQGGSIVLKPKVMVDRDIAEGLMDAKSGRVSGPFASSKDAGKFLDSRGSKRPPKRSKK